MTNNHRPEQAALAGLVERVEQVVSAWAFAHNIDGAIRNDLFARLRTALATRESDCG